ncbi:MAG: ABC transporter permease [Candidatus Riflebacteria bacterium]|nr:ABC transporter permease [Candidatus Riflebacteria bacterium]
MTTVDISIGNLAFAYLAATVIWAFSRAAGEEIGKSLITSIARMTLQLFLLGYVLLELFRSSNWIFTVSAYLLMLLFGTQLIISRCGVKFKGIYLVIASSMGISVTTVMAYFTLLVIQSDSVMEPRHIIPIAGMILCNSMNGAALAVERFFSALRSSRNDFETLLSLGATVNEASKSCFKQAFRASLMPMMMTMSSAGLVSIPGMMVGQILCGASPLVSVKYQIAILIAMTTSVSITAFLSLKLACRYFFTDTGTYRDDIFRVNQPSDTSQPAQRRPKVCGGAGTGCR